MNRDEERPIEIPRDLRWLEEQIREKKVKLVIIDPFFGFLADLKSDIEIRKTMMQVRDLAQRTSCCIIGLRHLNKSSNPKALYRGSGHIAYGGAARAVLVVGQDPADEEKRILAVSKINLAKKPTSLRYTLQALPSGVCKVAWEGACTLCADDLVMLPPTPEQKEAKEDEKTKEEQALAILSDLLAAGPRTVKECKEAGTQLGIKARTMERASKKLAVSISYMTSDDGKRIYYW